MLSNGDTTPENILKHTIIKYIVTQTYESTVSITQGYNIAKLRKIKNKYTIQVFKLESPLSQPTLESPPPIWDLPCLEVKKIPTPLKKFLKPKSPHPIVQEGEKTMNV